MTPIINFCTGAHILIPPALGVGQNLKQGKGGYTRHSPNPHYRDTGRGHVGCSSKPDQYDGLVPPELHGWVIDDVDDVGYSIDWEAQEVQQQIQKTLEFLSRGCTCTYKASSSVLSQPRGSVVLWRLRRICTVKWGLSKRGMASGAMSGPPSTLS